MHCRWQQGQVWRGLKVYQHQLKMAAMSHWRLYCQERHVQRLQQALAARWVAAWTKRKVCALPKPRLLVFSISYSLHRTMLAFAGAVATPYSSSARKLGPKENQPLVLRHCLNVCRFSQCGGWQHGGQPCRSMP